ncbi:hypothetical protein [Aeoliella mucimassa]|uniref:Uncharacterized protein n=1 Tax=Aeoliella mucimassa TaxID=2527972 RepID=A0A518AQZ4_9BACT|nr:hypothetical protein [Aeoliella mucimassa]QDU57151.1 hypothetical protein Pan181_33650 [Aeoliella mucimassa]
MTDAALHLEKQQSLRSRLLIATLVVAGFALVLLVATAVLPPGNSAGLVSQEPPTLTITDPSLLHATCVESYRPWRWKWQIYVPATKGTVALRLKAAPTTNERASNDIIQLDASKPFRGELVVQVSKQVGIPQVELMLTEHKLGHLETKIIDTWLTEEFTQALLDDRFEVQVAGERITATSERYHPFSLLELSCQEASGVESSENPGSKVSVVLEY